jgi:hypothetical protein
MCMRRYAVVDMLGDLMIVRPRLIGGVDMHDDAAEVAHVVEELVADLLGDGMPLSHRQCRCHRNAHFCPTIMAHPAGLHLCHRLHSWDVRSGVLNFVDDLWVHPI